MKEITILLTRYSDWISSFVYHVAGHGYTHASLSLGEGVITASTTGASARKPWKSTAASGWNRV